MAATPDLAASAAGLAQPVLNAHDTQVLVVAAVGIAIIVVLIVWLKLHAFLALTVGALFVGVGSGIPLGKVTASYETGVGGVLGYVGVLIALGAMVGKLLADSGGADKVVDTLLRGRPATLPWKMALIAAIIGIPMFFEIGLVLLIPVVMLAVHRSKGPAMRLGIPALAGLSVLHGFIPPHPGPLAAIAILHANVGVTLALGLLVALPTVAIAGPLYGIVAARLVPIGAAGAGLAVTQGGGAKAASDDEPTPTHNPAFGTIMATLLFPLVLMLGKAGADIFLDKASPARPVLRHPQTPRHVAARVRDAIDDRADHHARHGLAGEEREDAQRKTDVERDPQRKEIHAVKKMAPHRTEHQPRKIGDHAGQQRDQTHARRLAVLGVGKELHAQRQHHQIGEAHQHPANQRAAKQRVVAHETQGAQRMHPAIPRNGLGRAARQTKPGKPECATEHDQQPRGKHREVLAQ